MPSILRWKAVQLSLYYARFSKSRSLACTTGHYGTQSATISGLERGWVVSIVRVGVPWFSPALTRSRSRGAVIPVA
jgi:hypothetical protein